MARAALGVGVEGGFGVEEVAERESWRDVLEVMVVVRERRDWRARRMGCIDLNVVESGRR